MGGVCGGVCVGQSCLNLKVIIFFFLCSPFRTLIYSLISRSKPTPMFTNVPPFLFCIYNGYLQGRYMAKYAVCETDYHWSLNFIVGMYTSSKMTCLCMSWVPLVSYCIIRCTALNRIVLSMAVKTSVSGLKEYSEIP